MLLYDPFSKLAIYMGSVIWSPFSGVLPESSMLWRVEEELESRPFESFAKVCRQMPLKPFGVILPAGSFKAPMASSKDTLTLEPLDLAWFRMERLCLLPAPETWDSLSANPAGAFTWWLWFWLWSSLPSAISLWYLNTFMDKTSMKIEHLSPLLAGGCRAQWVMPL